MTWQLKNKPRLVHEDVAFELWDETAGRVFEVTVSREAIDDYCDPRDIKGDALRRFDAALADILMAADKLIAKNKNERRIVIKTRDLNG